MTQRFRLVNDSQRNTTVLSRAPDGQRVYTLLRDGSVAFFDPGAAYELSDPLENPSEDDCGEPPHLMRLLALSDDELVAADLETAYRYRVVDDALEELARTSLLGRASVPYLRLASVGSRVFASASEYLVEVGGDAFVDSEGDDFVHVGALGGGLVTGRASGVVELRDPHSLAVIKTFPGHGVPVIALGTAPHHDLVAVADDSARLWLLHTTTGATTPLPVPGKVVGLAFAGDGERLVVTGLSRTVSICQLASPDAPLVHHRFPEVGRGYLLASLLLDDERLLVAAESMGIAEVQVGADA